MVNRGNRLEGHLITEHPLAAEGLGIYSMGPTVLAAQAMVGGVLHTASGDQTFQAGDWIVTDNPPSHAFVVREQVFAQKYQLEREISAEEAPKGDESKHTLRRPEIHPVSAPPTISPQMPGASPEPRLSSQPPLIETPTEKVVPEAGGGEETVKPDAGNVELASTSLVVCAECGNEYLGDGVLTHHPDGSHSFTPAAEITGDTPTDVPENQPGDLGDEDDALPTSPDPIEAAAEDVKDRARSSRQRGKAAARRGPRVRNVDDEDDA